MCAPHSLACARCGLTEAQAPFWLGAIVYSGMKVDMVDAAAERRFGALGKACWLSAVTAVLWAGQDPPVAVLLPQPSPFYLLRVRPARPRRRRALPRRLCRLVSLATSRCGGSSG